MVMDELLEEISNHQPGGTINNPDIRVATMAFADDVFLLEDREDMALSIARTADFLRARGMEINIKKYVTVSAAVVSGRSLPRTRPVFRYGREYLSIVGVINTFRYLGHTISGQGIVKPSIHHLSDWLSRLGKAPLKLPDTLDTQVIDSAYPRKAHVTVEGNKDPWKSVYNLLSEKVRSDNIFNSVLVENTETLSWVETVSAILDRFLPTADIGMLTAEQQQTVNENLSYNVDQIDPPFSMEELDLAVESIKLKTAPGCDLIEPEILNRCLFEGIFPDIWKPGEIRLLAKNSVKPANDPKAYRPVTLLPVMGKLYERLLMKRILRYYEASDTTVENQFGFKAGKSTVDAVVHLQLTANAEEKYVLGIYRYCWCIRQLVVAQHFQKVTIMTVVIKSKYDSVSKVISKGYPQGCVLEPSLWNIVFDEIVEENIEGMARIAYADDLVILVMGNSRAQLETRAVVALNRYLGIVLDDKGSFVPHMEYVRDKVKNIFAKLWRVTRKDWGLRPTALALYEGVFVSIATDGVPVWAGKLHTPPVLKRLASAQPFVLLGITRACRTVSNDALQVLADKRPINLVAAERAHLYWAKRGDRRSIMDIANVPVVAEVNVRRGVRDERRRLRYTMLLKWQESMLLSDVKELFANVITFRNNVLKDNYSRRVNLELIVKKLRNLNEFQEQLQKLEVDYLVLEDKQEFKDIASNIEEIKSSIDDIRQILLARKRKILCTNQPKKFYWSRVDFNDSVDPVMKDAVKGGFQDGYNLFIGTMNHEGENKIGKVIGVDDHKSKGLYVWDKDGTKVRILAFFMLKYNFTTDFSDDYAIYKN
ncbi:Reverse transcriptase (RNA-dependent DNA polymerase) [Popillia japonica]|uniref:Reverse transcriptase (RNA-dependent DNA polymerase) n=1 Tax=Popillia japonica TaxID=7064 RepID=A0AAW1MP64_POPJA